MKRIITFCSLIVLFSCSSETTNNNDSTEPIDVTDSSVVVEEGETNDIDSLSTYVGYYNIADEGVFQMDDSKEYDQTRSYHGIVIEYSDGLYSAFEYDADEYMNGTGTFNRTFYDNEEQREDGILYFETNTEVPEHIDPSGNLSNIYRFEKVNDLYVRTNYSGEREITIEYYKTEELPKYIKEKLSEL